MLSKKQWGVIGAILVIVITAWFTWAIFGVRLIQRALHFSNAFQSAGQIDLAAAGQWGDAFGGLNVLIGAIGACLVLATLMTQRNALKEQQADLHKDRFDSSFFELLKLMRELKEQTFTASPGISQNTIQTSARLMEIHANTLLQNKKTTREDVTVVYDQTHTRFERQLGPYFRIVYTIMKRIRNDDRLTEVEKINYGNLLRSQLTSDEIALAGYNGLLDISNDFSDFLADFRMLKYLPPGVHRDILMPLYPTTAFEARKD